MKKSWSLLFPLACCALSNSWLSNSVSAQVAADGTTNTTVNSDNNGNFTIEQGDRAGNNLFHSFGDFSVPTNGSAFFNNATDVSNIFSRVTGGNISNIDGLIQANGSANLFLINPAGILFGNNAQLDIGGSFLGTTADSILFEDGVFSATDLDNPPLLTINAPIGLNFRDNPAPIETNSTASADFPDLNPDVTFDDNLFGLRVRDGKTFALAGGDIIADGGGIVAVGGRIELGAVGESGTVGINFEEDNLSFDFPDDLAKANVSLVNNAGFLVSGSGGGDIVITANNIEILEGSGLFAGIFSGLGSVDAKAGDITINASSLSVIGESSIDSRTSGLGNAGNVFIEAQEITFSNSNIFTEVSSDGGIGDAGDINISTNSLLLQNDAAFLADTENIGDAGDITIEASDRIVLEGDGRSQITSTVDAGTNPNVTGNAGNIEITTESLSITDRGFISTSTFGNGNGGKITINASNSVSLGNEGGNGLLSSSIESGAIGNSGGVEINTGSLFVNNSSQIRSQVLGQGNSGKIIINAQDTVSFDGRDSTDTFPSAAFSRVIEGGNGNSGGIEINANSLSLSNRAQLSSTLSGTGSSGDIIINTNEEVLLSNSIIISEVSDLGGSGDGGDINITTDSLILQDGSSLLADTENIGDAGNINIEAQDRVVLEGEGFSAGANSTNIVFSQISTTAESNASGKSGNINISANELSIDEGFISSSTSNTENAGNVIVSSNNLFLTNGGQILSLTFDDGNASNITLNVSDTLIVREGAQISASNFLGSGSGGIVDISASEIILDGEGLEDFNNGFNSGIFSTIEPNASGTAGGINIKTNNLTITNGAEIDASTFGDGNGGNITIDVDDTITLDGQDSLPNSLGLRSDSGIFANVETGALGNGGNINIFSGNLIISNGADIDVGSKSQGNGGNLFVNTGTLSLDSGSILSSTGFAEGGNIELNVADNITLENNSLISAQALNEAKGGNLTIDANFIIGFPNEIPGNGSDIIANAVDGDGGNITISAESLLGIEPGIPTPGNKTNDINADSQSGLDGTISIFTPDVTSIQGATELPNNVVEPTQTVAQACSNNRGTALASNFVINGKGGIPPVPDAPMGSDMIIVNGGVATNDNNSYAISTSIGEINLARGVIKTADGKIILTPTPVSGDASRMPHGSLNCG